MSMKTDYLQFAGHLSDQVWARYNDKIEEAVSSSANSNEAHHKFGFLAHAAAIEAVRFQAGCGEFHALRSKKALLAIPAIDNLFNVSECLRAVYILQGSGLLEEQELAVIQRYIEPSMESIFRMQDWGPHNRAAHRSLSLHLAAKCFPDHEKAASWNYMSQILMADNWGKWSIEDSSIYLPIWLNALFHYEQVTNKKGLFELPMTRYYCDYLTRLLNPRGVVTDFGDGGWGDGWARVVACLERGASVYRSSDMKYAARSVFRTMAALDNQASDKALRMASALLDAYLWANDEVDAAPPEYRSEEVLDDIIGKKIVFRDGWEERSTFLLLNYRDEGDYGFTPRNYLRHTIRGDVEKMHHGHADENSIVSLIHGGNILLHDAGYRDSIDDTDGAYRADFYHNSVIVRKGLPLPNQSFLNFCRDSGTYRKVQSEKIHFTTFHHVDVSRTRVKQAHTGTIWDRSIYYLKRENVFVIADVVQAEQEGEFSFGPVFYSGRAKETAPGGFMTAYDTIGAVDQLEGKVTNEGDTELFIYFPLTGSRTTGIDCIRRSYTTESAVFQSYSGFMSRGDIIPFVTVLYPVSPTGFDAEAWVCNWSVHTDSLNKSTAIEFKTNEGTHTIGCKNDLSHGISDASRRPAYRFADGCLTYGGLATDADFVHGFHQGESFQYALLNATRLDVDGQTAFEVPTQLYKQLDLSMREGVSSRSQWEDVIQLKEV